MKNGIVYLRAILKRGETQQHKKIKKGNDLIAITCDVMIQFL